MATNTSQPSGSSIKPMDFTDDYDPATNTYNYGHLTGMTIDQYENAYQAQKNGTLDSFDPNASGSSVVSSTTSADTTFDDIFNSSVANGGVPQLAIDAYNSDGTVLPGYSNIIDAYTTGGTGNSTTSGSTTSGIMSNTASSQPAQIIQQMDTSGLATSSGMDTGFASVGNQISNVGTQVGNAENNITGQIGDLSGNIATGLTGLNTNLGTVNSNLEAGIGDVNSNLETGFSGVNTNVNDQFAGQNQNLTDLSANVLGGQTNLQNYLEGFSDRADTYYGGLSDGQSGIMSDIGGLQSGLSDFRNTYDDNTTMANQARNQLVEQVTGGFSAQDDSQSEYNAAAQKERADISAAVSQQPQAAPQAGANFSQGLMGVSSGTASATPGSAQNQANTATDRLSAVRQLLATSSQNLSPELRMQYETLASSFDDAGRLIPLTADQAGNRTQRTLDNQGNLIYATLDPQNQITNQGAINVNNLLSYMNQLGYSANTSTGSNQPAVNTFG
jgi:hypothetical protein